MGNLYSFYRPEKHTTRPLPASRIPRELSSERGAKALAQEIEAWWHSRGYTQVQAWVDGRAFVSTGGNVYTVRTNLVRGMPPREATKA